MTKTKVNIFIPCFIDQLFPQTGFNMVKVLEEVGCEVHYNPNQTCCGQPAYNAGYFDEAREVAHKFLNDFSSSSPPEKEKRGIGETERRKMEQFTDSPIHPFTDSVRNSGRVGLGRAGGPGAGEGAGYIVSPSASCVGMIRNGYDLLIENLSALNQCRNIQKNIFEFSEFLVDVLKIDSIKGATLNGIATYHDSCSALRECGIKEAPRKLLKNVKGLKLVEMKDNETCCGFGGTFSVKFEPISVAMAQQKVDNALAVNADYIISTDSSCLLHIDGYIKKNNIKIKTMHIADVLASR